MKKRIQEENRGITKAHKESQLKPSWYFVSFVVDDFRRRRRETLTTNKPSRHLLQLRVFGFGVLQDGEVGIGVFPQRKEVLVGAAALGRNSRERIGPAQSEMSKRHQWIAGRKISQGQNPLKFLSGFVPLAGFQIAKPSKVKYRGGAFVVRRGRFQYFDHLGTVAGAERSGSLHDRN